jgi:GrpB-like predicted nucleotidyltransferase (UPF0157 family)
VSATITIVDYDPSWPALFEEEAARICAVLGDRALMIEHVGSTSVPGLAAKPRIDLLLVVKDSADEAAYIPTLESAGYVVRIREPHWHEHRMLSGPATKINLHCFSNGCPEIQRMIAFRDRLRAHETDRRLYERAKRDLATRKWKSVQQYADAKSEIVEEILKRCANG